MPETTLLLRHDDPAWDIWVKRAPHDFYHRSAYHAFAEQMGEGKAFLVVYGSPDRFMAWPYLLCAIDGTRVDANSVYGYAGPVGVGLDDGAFVHRAWSGIRGVWAEQGLATLFTRFHPMLANQEFCEGLHGAACPAGGELLHLGRSVSIDLAADQDTRRRGYPRVMRQEINAAERAGLVVEEDHRWTHYPEFFELYRLTMQKNRASERHRFTDRYFQGLRPALGDMGHLLIARRHGKTAAILLMTVCGEIAQAHLTGVNPDFLALSPLKCLLDQSAEVARRHGANWLHLGAGRGGYEDSLYQFKSRFSPIRHDFTLGRWILDQAMYDALVAERGTQAHHNREYFPAYRA